MAKKFPDVQGRKDKRGVEIKKAGIRHFLLPIVVYSKDKNNGTQPVTADVNIYTSLDADKKGVHLSNLIEAILFCPTCVISKETVKTILETAKGDAKKAFIEMEFVYFKEKESPVSKTKAPLDYKARIVAEVGQNFDFLLSVDVPVMTLCPDSKEISNYGAHNQRSIVTVKAKGYDIWFEDLIHHAEQNASCQMYQVLKKEDDKYVSETMYENPQFAEDLVREISVSMKKDRRIKWFSVETENLESNHNYNAYAYAESS